jgi:hypothetical protein
LSRLPLIPAIWTTVLGIGRDDIMKHYFASEGNQQIFSACRFATLGFLSPTEGIQPLFIFGGFSAPF